MQQERERFIYAQSEDDDYYFDYTANEDVEIDGVNFKFVETYRTKGDGEWWAVVMQRETDGKYFEFSWGISFSQNYYYEEEWYEVVPISVKTVWGWK